MFFQNFNQLFAACLQLAFHFLFTFRLVDCFRYSKGRASPVMYLADKVSSFAFSYGILQQINVIAFG